MNQDTMKIRNWGATLLCLAAAAAGCSGVEGELHDEAVASQEGALAAAEPGENLRYFDGRDDRVVVPQRAEYDLGTGDFTLAVTAKVTNPASQTVVPLISKRRAAYPYDGFYFIVYGDRLLLQIRGVNTLSPPVPSLRNGEWRHLAVRRMGGALTFFVDGEPVGTGTNAGNATGPVDMTFGYDALDQRGLRGMLRDVAVWSAALPNNQLQVAAGGNKLLGSTSRGYWDIARVGKDLVTDESSLGNHGHLGTVAGSWDVQDPTPQQSLPVVGARIGSISSSRMAGATESCGDVLADGVFDTFLSSGATAFTSEVQEFMCNNFEHVMNSKGSIGLTIPIKGVPVSLSGSKEDSETFKNEYCQASSESFDYATAHTIATQIASPVIVDAWLECMQLKQATSIVQGSQHLSTDGRVITLGARTTIKVDEQDPTTVYTFEIVGASCASPWQTNDQIRVTGSSILCTRTGNSPVTAILNTNHGPVVWTFGPSSTAEVWVTGSRKEWAAQGQRCVPFTTNKYNCPDVRFPRPDCKERNGRTWYQEWRTAADERATNAQVIVTSDASLTKDYGSGPTSGTYSTHVWGKLHVYKQTAVSWKLCADVEKLSPAPYSTGKADVDTLMPFVVETPADVESPVLHLMYTDGTKRVVDLANPGQLAAVYAVTDQTVRHYEVTMN